MRFSIDIHSRARLIGFGHRLGRIMRAAQREKPWIICAGADRASGKSLLALAIDEIFNPQRYPEGVTPELDPDQILDFEKKGRVVFYNFGSLDLPEKPLFDELLERIEAQNPQAKVLFISNVARGGFDYRDGLRSDRLDMNLQFYIAAGAFRRRIDVTAEDEWLIGQLPVAASPRRREAVFGPAI